MRIIGGVLKGREISFLKNSNTRPLKDNVKENVFNILNHSNLFEIKIENSNILDLYSGIGSFGIECLSRGAKKVTSFAPLEMHSIPNEPMPEYKSRTVEFSIFVFITLECCKTLKMLSFTLSLRGLVLEFFKKFIGLPFNDPPIILIYLITFQPISLR